MTSMLQVDKPEDPRDSRIDSTETDDRESKTKSATQYNNDETTNIAISTTEDTREENESYNSGIQYKEGKADKVLSNDN